MSDEIQHGLGEGQVSVVVGLEEIDKTILADQASTMKKYIMDKATYLKAQSLSLIYRMYRLEQLFIQRRAHSVSE